MADDEPSSPPIDAPSVLSYETPEAREPLRWFKQEKPWLPLLVIFCILVVLAFILIPATTRGGGSPRVACMSNLRQLGLLMTQYAAIHNNEYPDSFETLILFNAPNFQARFLICPTSNDKPPTYQTATELAQRLGSNGRPDNFAAASSKPSLHFSYIYYGAGLTMRSSPKSILAYEPLANHGKTINFLFRDTHVESIPAATALKMTKELQSGHNPPRPEVVGQ